MSERSGFFPYVTGDSNSEYDHAFLARYVASFIGNGAYDGTLAVTAGDHMQVVIPTGQAWINGYYYRNDGNLILPVANADGVLHRKDTVVLRWDTNTRSITAQILTGTFSSAPVAPAIIRSAEQYDLKLAEISIPAGTTAITQALITDTRLDNSVCGIVTGVVHQVDTTALYNQIQSDLANFKSGSETGFATWSDQQKAAFNTWFNTVKGQLSGDAAGHLQTEIDTITAAKGQPNGYAGLDANGKLAQMPTAAQVGAVSKSGDTMAGPLSITDILQVTRADGTSVGSLMNNQYGTSLYRTRTSDGKICGISISYDGSINVFPFGDGSSRTVLMDAAGKKYADSASGSVPLTTPGLRNAVVINKADAIPTGLADGTVVLRKQV